MTSKPDARWGGCATLTQDDPKLWIVEQQGASIGEVLGFSLAEVLEAGLRAKIIGLPNGHREVAIAECVSDALEQFPFSLQNG